MCNLFGLDLSKMYDLLAVVSSQYNICDLFALDSAHYNMCDLFAY